VKALIFDFDGTIADSFETLLGIFEEITKRQNKLTPKEVNELRSKNLRGIITYLGIKRWQIPRMILAAKRRISLKITFIKTFPGMPETLRQLSQNGQKMYILSTNSSDNITKFLKKNGLDGYFEGIYGDIGLRSKSSAIKKIVRKEKLDKVDCAYIGDEVRDITAAKKAGVTSVGVTWGFNHAKAIKQSRPSLIANHPKNLVKLLK